MMVKELLNMQSIGEIRNVRVQLFREAHENDADHDLLPWRVIPEKGGGGHVLRVLLYFHVLIICLCN